MPENCAGSGQAPLDWSARNRRGTCPVCNRPRVKMKADGTLHAHTVPQPDE